MTESLRPDPAPESGAIQAELSRDLGLVSVLAIGIGTMVAAGIFTLSGLAVGYVGSAAIVSFLLAALVATFTALTYCEFASIYPESGEGYLYARRTFSPPVAYLVGWCLLLGYCSSCGFYIASLSSYFNEFIWHPPVEWGAGIVGLVALALLNVKGTKESGSFQIVVTLGKVVLLLWFVLGGLGHVDGAEVVARFSQDYLMIGSTAALVFITFFGFSAIAATAGEVRDPTRTIPRAIFISMGVVTLLYSLVVLVVVAANLTEYDEAAMGEAANLFLGPIGGTVIVAGALFSMISASNASIMAGSRVALSMSRLGHLPEEVGAINADTRTPVIAVLLVSGAIGTFAISLPLEELAHFADVVLLTVLILVNVALILHRRMYPALERPFRVPFVPLLPALGVVANLYLLTQISHVRPLLLAVGAVFVGLVGFLAWKGRQDVGEVLPGAPSRIALERSSAPAAGFRVLVPIANPATVDRLIELAADIAHERDGQIVVLRVVEVPEQLPPTMEDQSLEREAPLLERARQVALARGVGVTTLVRIGHSASRAILETAAERSCDVVLLGWKGYTSTARRILGEVTDDVLRLARCDVILVRFVGDAPPERLLLSTRGSAHDVRIERYAGGIARARGGSITIAAVVPETAPPEKIQSEENRLAEETRRLRGVGAEEAPAGEAPPVPVEARVIRHRAVSGGILDASLDHDAIVLGATGQGFGRVVLLGSVPEEVARNAERTVIMVKHYQPVRALLGRVMSE